jgi:hypothetical protein
MKTVDLGTVTNAAGLGDEKGSAAVTIRVTFLRWLRQTS